MKVKKVDWTFNKVSSEASGEVLNDVSSINKKAKQQISGEQHHTTQSSETEHMVVFKSADACQRGHQSDLSVRFRVQF